MTVVDVGDIQLDYERAGAGPPLLLIMGMSGTALSWGRPFLELLERDFDVIAYDHRGVGASSRLEGPITTAEMAEDASGLLRALELESAHVLGISMGGMVAQELALAHPEQIHTLSLGCTYCGGPRGVLGEPIDVENLRQARTTGNLEAAARGLWELNVSRAFAADADEYAAFIARGMRRPVALEVIGRQGRAVVAHDTSARLSEIDLPTLVVHGTEDRLLPVENARVIADLIPHARLEIYDGVGHLFFLEQPERTATLLREHAAVHA